jgi:hypothetical protein
VDTAEDDGPAVLAPGRKLAELEAVPTKIGESNDLVLLIVVSQDQQRLSQF